MEITLSTFEKKKNLDFYLSYGPLKASALRKQNKEVWRNIEELQNQYNSLKRKKDKHSQRTVGHLLSKQKKKKGS